MTTPIDDERAAVMEQARAVLADFDARHDTMLRAALAAVTAFLDTIRTAILRGGATPELDEFPPPQVWDAAITEHLDAEIRAAFTTAYLAVFDRAGQPTTVFAVEPFVTRYMESVHDRLRDWPQGVFEDIREEVTEALTFNESVAQMRDRIGRVLDIDAPAAAIRRQITALTRTIDNPAASPDQVRSARTKRRALYAELRDEDKAWKWRAERIARTESAAAVNGGTYEAHLTRAAATGERVRKQWLATGDERVRHSHAAANGQVRPLTEPFYVGGAPLLFPGDPHGPGHEVINCRCALLILHEGMDPVDLGPIGDDALEAAAAAGVTYHGRPGDHPTVPGGSLIGGSGYRKLLSLQEERWKAEPLPAGFRDALLDYTGTGYSEVNDNLRTDTNDAVSDPTVIGLDEGFADARAVLPERAVVHRAVKGATRMFAGLTDGDEFVDKGFVSTTFDSEAAQEGFGGGAPRKGKKPNFKDVALVSITVPAGSRGIIPSALSAGKRGEDELLLPRGTKFHVVEISTRPSGLTRVKLEVVDTPDNKSAWPTVTAAAAEPPPEIAAEEEAAGVEPGDPERFVWEPEDIVLVKDIAPPTEVGSDDAVAAAVFHNRPGDHPISKGRYLRGLDAEDTITDYQREEWGAYPLPGRFFDALKAYTGNDYGVINNSLRHGDGRPDSRTYELDAGFSDARAITTENVVVYRGMGDVEETLAELRPGDEWIDRGFISTSFNKDAAEAFTTESSGGIDDTAVISILVPAGSRAIAPLALDASDSQGESELLLPRGTKFHVVDINFDEQANKGAGGWTVELEVVSTPDPDSLVAAAQGRRKEREGAHPDKFVWVAGDVEIVKRDQPAPAEHDGDEPAADDSLEAAMTAATDAPVTATALPDGWRGILAPLGVPSGDGRVITDPGDALNVRPLPLPLLAQEALAEGHDGAIVVGLIENVWVQDGALWGEGRFDLDDDRAAAWARRVGDGYAGWVSVDLDDATMSERLYRASDGELVELELIPDPDAEAMGLDGVFLEPDIPEGHQLVYAALKWRLMASTLVAQGAFYQARVNGLWGYTGPGTGTPTPPALAAGADDMTRNRRTYAFPPPKKDGPPAVAKPPALPDDDEESTWVPKVGDRVVVDDPEAGGPGEVTKVDSATDPIMVTVQLDAGGPVDVEVSKVTPEKGADTEQEPEKKKAPPFPPKKSASSIVRAALAAAAGTEELLPPRAWYADPRLDAPTPLTVTDDGRVFGHLAVWDTCHVGITGQCVTPPRTATGYALFHTGEVEVDDGTLLPVGKVTLGTGHADPEIGFRAAADHYDNTGAVVATVRAYEDAHGIAVAGSLCPGTDQRLVAALRRSPLSGDWRRVGGTLELIAALAVNVPGFPVRRPAIVASTGDAGRPMSLVAAGALTAPTTEGRLGDVIGKAVARVLDEREQRTRRATAARARVGAQDAPWVRTRAAVAAARINGTGKLATSTAAAHGYNTGGAR